MTSSKAMHLPVPVGHERHPGTITSVPLLIARRILPALGDRDFQTVTRHEVQALHASLKHIPGSANYVLCIIGSLYRRIIVDWELADMKTPPTGSAASR